MSLRTEAAGVRPQRAKCLAHTANFDCSRLSQPQNLKTPPPPRGKRVFITNVKATFFGMSESEEASKRR